MEGPSRPNAKAKRRCTAPQPSGRGRALLKLDVASPDNLVATKASRTCLRSINAIPVELHDRVRVCQETLCKPVRPIESFAKVV